ncbi:MAG: hypothetical protein ACPF9D_05410, partial [Owenweeksia sp.]
MKFSTVKSSRKAEYTVYLYSRKDDLQDLSLTEAELGYVTRSIKKETVSVARINRYNSQFIMVSCPDSGRKDYEKEEQIRLAGNKVFKELKSEKA